MVASGAPPAVPPSTESPRFRGRFFSRQKSPSGIWQAPACAPEGGRPLCVRLGFSHVKWCKVMLGRVKPRKGWMSAASKTGGPIQFETCNNHLLHNCKVTSAVHCANHFSKATSKLLADPDVHRFCTSFLQSLPVQIQRLQYFQSLRTPARARPNASNFYLGWLRESDTCGRGASTASGAGASWRPCLRAVYRQTPLALSRPA